MDTADEVTIAELQGLVTELLFLRGERDNFRRLSAQYDERVDETELKLVNMLEAAGMARFDTDEATIFRSSRSGARVPKTPAEREAFFAYLRERGLFDHMVTVNSQTLNSWLKEEMRNAEERGDIGFEVPGLNVEVRQVLSLRKRTA